MIKFKLHLTDKTRSFTSKKNGKTYTLVGAYLFLPSSPYPEKIEVFAPNIAKPAGEYIVTANVSVRDNRLSLNLDMNSLESK